MQNLNKGDIQFLITGHKQSELKTSWLKSMKTFDKNFLFPRWEEF